MQIEKCKLTIAPLSFFLFLSFPFFLFLSLSFLSSSLSLSFPFLLLSSFSLSFHSPLGSPVQARLIAKRIRDLADEKDVPVYAFAEDVAASGGYWLALAADEIYADENSVIGSIGVVSGGFGFTELIKRMGIERRLHTSGDKKALLDPFKPEKPAEVKHLKDLMSEIHESFRSRVLERRGKRLKAKEKELFSGAFWTGTRALEMGLIDGIGDLRSVMRAKFGDKVKLKSVAKRQSFLRRRFGSGVGMSGAPEPGGWATAAIAAIEERLIWNRFGL